MHFKFQFDIIYQMKITTFVVYLIIATVVAAQNQVIQSNAHNHTIYHIVPDYTTYQQYFASNVGSNYTREVTHLGTGKELCRRTQACRFYIYLYEPENKEDIKYNMLVVSGMHGNELIGPTTLLYAYPLLKPKHTRIIYFPICNPSGYELKKRQTFPQNIDPNRDFPIDNNTACYQGSATRILDSIFRNYTIDLTVNLHNGGDQIAWNWGTFSHQKYSETEDQSIYAPIGAMLKLYGGYNERMKILPFDIGTMNKVVYPAEGTFDDWAYAGSWTESVPFKCDKYNYEPYPKQMHQGLVFLMQLGMHNAPEGLLGTSQGLQKPSNSNETSNGYVTRTLRMLRQLVFVVQPAIHAEISGSKLLIKIEGCHKIQSLHVQALNQKNQQKNKIELNQTITDFVSRRDSFSYISKVNVKQIQYKQSGFELKIRYSLQCDKKWVNKGKTFLSRPRVFEGNMSIIKYIGNNDKKQKILKINGQTTDMNINQYFLLVIPVVLFIFLTYMMLCRNKCKRKQKERNRPRNDRTATSHNLSTHSGYNSNEFQEDDNDNESI